MFDTYNNFSEESPTDFDASSQSMFPPYGSPFGFCLFAQPKSSYDELVVQCKSLIAQCQSLIRVNEHLQQQNKDLEQQIQLLSDINDLKSEQVDYYKKRTKTLENRLQRNFERQCEEEGVYKW